MACKQSADCKHYNAWWCDKRPGCDDFEKKESKSEPIITEPKEEAPKSKRKKADK